MEQGLGGSPQPRESDGKNLWQANKSRDQAIGGERGGASKEADGNIGGKRQKRKRRGCFLLVGNSGKPKGHSKEFAFARNQKMKKERTTIIRDPKGVPKKLDIHVRGGVMVSSAPSPSSCQCLLSGLLPYAEDETGIGPGDAVDTPFKRSSNLVKDVH